MSAQDPVLPAALRKSDYEALADFRYQIRRYLRFSETISHQHGITVLQYLLLLQLKGYPGREWATIAELAERLQADHHGVVTLVTRCEEAGLVERRKGEGDRRVVKVVLRPKGEERRAAGARGAAAPRTAAQPGRPARRAQRVGVHGG